MMPIVNLDEDIAERVELGIDRLTDRQCEVLSLALAGLTAEESGVHLGISTRTVEAHLLTIRRIIGVHTIVLIGVHIAALEARSAVRRREGILTHF